ncbi:GspH/FimT family pseudopilin [Comamonas flocculans]|uniref:Type II secretion system protein H n=1 Tax=Comamonas flocculans TaxID=2597701 RepID=A0A5B8RVZ6_9BURK|nr:prepilin-type N-terminal cleavage/methylation domain-containing protein [Comamonas flocculans]
MPLLPFSCAGVPRQARSQSGFTVIELLVTVAILAVLAALAAPSFNPIIERWRVRGAAEDLQSTIYYARSEAIKRGGGIVIDATGGWSQGWKVGLTSGGAPLREFEALRRVSATQSSSKTKLYVDRWGMVSETDGGVAAAMSILVKPEGKDDGDSSAIRLCIAEGSRVFQKSHGAACA